MSILSVGAGVSPSFAQHVSIQSQNKRSLSTQLISRPPYATRARTRLHVVGRKQRGSKRELRKQRQQNEGRERDGNDLLENNAEERSALEQSLADKANARAKAALKQEKVEKKEEEDRKAVLAAIPVPTREDVIGAAIRVSLILGVAGNLGRKMSFFAADREWLGGAVQDWNIVLPLGVPEGTEGRGFLLAAHFLAALVTAGVVTGARQVLLNTSPDFKQATDYANVQVLRPLKGDLDLGIVALASGAGEELLFRGALLPAVGVTWQGVLISGAVFGGLHVTGGRNWTFAAWATFVGSIYGALALGTHDLYAPIAAHALANFFSAERWKDENLDLDSMDAP